jgi:hypothetical protein
VALPEDADARLTLLTIRANIQEWDEPHRSRALMAVDLLLADLERLLDEDPEYG